MCMDANHYRYVYDTCYTYANCCPDVYDRCLYTKYCRGFYMYIYTQYYLKMSMLGVCIDYTSYYLMMSICTVCTYRTYVCTVYMSILCSCLIVALQVYTFSHWFNIVYLFFLPIIPFPAFPPMCYDKLKVGG